MFALSVGFHRDGSTSIWQAVLHGISDNLTALLKNRIGIPQKGNAESLNVAVAAGILLQHISK